MDIKLNYLQSVLAKQDFLEYDKILTEMINSVKRAEQINVMNKEGECVAELKTYEQMDTFHKRLVQVHGIYGYF